LTVPAFSCPRAARFINPESLIEPFGNGQDCSPRTARTFREFFDLQDLNRQALEWATVSLASNMALAIGARRYCLNKDFCPAAVKLRDNGIGGSANPHKMWNSGFAHISS
jgi:hypothetical protein